MDPPPWAHSPAANSTLNMAADQINFWNHLSNAHGYVPVSWYSDVIYNWNTFQYLDYYGNPVHFNTAHSSILNNADAVYVPFGYFTGHYNKDGDFKLGKHTFQGYYVIENGNWTRVIGANSLPPDILANPFLYVQDALGGFGISLNAAMEYIRAFAPDVIDYTTASGLPATVNSAQLQKYLKMSGYIGLALSIVLEGTLYATGMQSFGKLMANLGFTAIPSVLLGSKPGLVIGVVYLGLDKIGAFDGPSGQIYRSNPMFFAPGDKTKINKPLIIYNP
jgi:hypothetical protein